VPIDGNRKRRVIGHLTLYFRLWPILQRQLSVPFLSSYTLARDQLMFVTFAIPVTGIGHSLQKPTLCLAKGDGGSIRSRFHRLSQACPVLQSIEAHATGRPSPFRQIFVSSRQATASTPPVQ
jgi:hypothetical protein